MTAVSTVAVVPALPLDRPPVDSSLRGALASAGSGHDGRLGLAIASVSLTPLRSDERLGDEAHIHDDAALAGGEQVELVRVFDAVVFSSLERRSASAPATCSTDGNRKCLSEIGN